MTRASTPAAANPGARSPALAGRTLCLVGSAALLAAAGLGLTLWDQLPHFPPPAANDLLLTLRRLAVVALAVLGLASLPWIVRPGALPLVGVGVHVLALMSAVGTTVALRGEALAQLYWVPVLTSASACLAIVWSSARPADRRS